jgi:hypothetical protein
MKKRKPKSKDPEMLAEYDFSNGVRGKYYKRYMEATNVVVLDPDVARVFRNTKQVNEALRALAEIIKQHRKTKASA